MEKSDIYEIIEGKDERKLQRLVIKILESVIKGEENKDDVSYFPDFLVTIPLELGWKEHYRVKDKVLDEALSVIANFEGSSEKEARKKAKLLLVTLKRGAKEPIPKRKQP